MRRPTLIRIFLFLRPSDDDQTKRSSTSTVHSHFPNSAMRTTQHLLLLPLLSATLSSAAFARPPPFRSHCSYERLHSSLAPPHLDSRTCPSLPRRLCCPPRRVRSHAVTARLSPRGEIPHHFAPTPTRIPPLAHNPACGGGRRRRRRRRADITPSISSCRIIAPPDTSVHPMEADSSAVIALTPFPP